MNRVLAPEERDIDRLLAAVPPVAPPIGFRDAVMRQIAAERPARLGWAVVAALAIPSLAYISWAIAVLGADFLDGFENVFAILEGSQQEAFFFVDGLVVLAFALLAVASLVGAHVLLATERRPVR